MKNEQVLSRIFSQPSSLTRQCQNIVRRPRWSNNNAPICVNSRTVRHTSATTRCHDNSTLFGRPLATKPSVKSFTTSARVSKKGGKAAREESKASAPVASASSDDPYDFSALEADIKTCIERLKDDLSKLRAGGRFNPEVLENLRVQPDKASNQTVKLSDVAQVLPKGRTVQVMVGEKEHMKPVSSAIQSSSLSLTPQPDPTGANPLLLVINIPPPTADSRRAAVAQATKAGEAAGTSVRNARGAQQKKMRAMQLAKSARPDDLKKAGTQMEKVAETGSAEVKRIVDGAKKVLESS